MQLFDSVNMTLELTAWGSVERGGALPSQSGIFHGGAATQLHVEAVEKVVLERFVGYTGAITAGRG
jgi:hypothetical protein